LHQGRGVLYLLSIVGNVERVVGGVGRVVYGGAVQKLELEERLS
jgi:hypothetical protein